MSKRVNFIGVGVQKAGTTSIHRFLDEHPQLCVAHGRDKDTQFFGSFFDRGYEWYERHFDACQENQLIGEVSTSYFYNSDIPSRIKEYNSDVKIFVCLRNPVERIISNHKHEVRAGHVSGENLDLGAALGNNPAYTLQSKYSTHLRRWIDVFGRDNVHVLLFDDLVEDPAGFAKGLYRYLGVDDGFMPDLDKRDNVSRIPANAKVDRGIRRLGSILRFLGLGRLVNAGRKYGFNDWLRAKNTAKVSGPQISIRDETVSELRHLFAQEIDDLSGLLEMDLSRWVSD